MTDIKIGLEIHGYLKMNNKAKLFCNCQINRDSKPNTDICPICTGQPGNKPMLPNEQALKKIIAIALMLDCKINDRLMFQRKHYSWPDLPNGYQKTMSGSYSLPVAIEGSFLGIGIQQIHLEEDPAKWDPITGNIDYNRSGYPLVEIVTDPDFKDTDQVKDWLKKLLTTLSYIDSVEKNAGIKCDVNVSVKPRFDRVEIKNVNSIKGIISSINYEVHRQESEIKKGEKIKQQTRTWDDKTKKTLFMRSKETAMDYMFIPEPDLPTINISDDEIIKISEKLPEKPDIKLKKFLKTFKISEDDAKIISSDIILAEIFEKIVKKINPNLASKWIRRELIRVLNYNKIDTDEIKLNINSFIDLLDLLQNKKITETTAQKLLEELIVKDFNIKKHVKENNLGIVSNTVELEALCKKAIKENPKAIKDYKNGRTEALNYIVGQVMKSTKGKASPNEVLEILKKVII